MAFFTGWIIMFVTLAIWRLWVHLWPHKEPEVDPVLPSELDDWDAEFTRLTGKSIWQARCEADPELRKSVMELGTAQNNINPFRVVGPNEFANALQQQDRYYQMIGAQQDIKIEGCHFNQLQNQQQDQSQLSGLLGGLGNIGGLFH